MLGLLEKQLIGIRRASSSQPYVSVSWMSKVFSVTPSSGSCLFGLFMRMSVGFGLGFFDAYFAAGNILTV